MSRPPPPTFCRRAILSLPLVLPAPSRRSCSTDEILPPSASHYPCVAPTDWGSTSGGRTMVGGPGVWLCILVALAPRAHQHVDQLVLQLQRGKVLRLLSAFFSTYHGSRYPGTTWRQSKHIRI
eukprot:SAG11_NODE_1422_length_4951_cov_4.752112_2_plen_123_part_00